VRTLIDIRVLGRGHFGYVMLSEVNADSICVRMAVKVDEQQKRK